MTNPDYTAIVLVVDRSGSMAAISSTVEEALTEFVNGQKAIEGDLTIDTVFFDDHYEERDVFADPRKVDLDLSVHPRGMTALYDAVGKKINSFGEMLAKMKEKKRPGNVLFVIATDGHENKSTEFTQSAVAGLIKEQQDKYGWKFTFIGANQDAVMTARGLNISAEDSITFAANHEGTRSVLASMGTYTTAVRRGKSAAYSDSDRAGAVQSDSGLTDGAKESLDGLVGVLREKGAATTRADRAGE